MKTLRFVSVLTFSLVMAAALLQGESVARPADHASQQAPTQSGARPAGQKDEVRNDKKPAQAKVMDESQEQWPEVRRTQAKHDSSASHSKPVSMHQARPAKAPAKNSPRADTERIAAPPEPMDAKAATHIPNKAVSHQGPPAISSSVAVNGQRFKNSRDPGARLAASGGPATVARGTAAINGTNMTRKP
jgi:hypothetical protein